MNTAEQANNIAQLRHQIDMTADSLQSVSGLAKEQAKTCVYYALMTYLLPTYPDDYLIPPLCFQGNSGTGKSQATKLMAKIVNEPVMLNGRGKTFSDIALALHGVTTALIEEADFKQPRIETQLIQMRTERRHKTQVIHRPPEQTPIPIDNFGATILERRVPFSDAAVRNRTVTIKTVRRQGDFREVSGIDIDGTGLASVADYVRQHPIHMESSDRVMQCWRPLMEIAASLGDFDWIINLDAEYQKARKMLAVGDQYESEDVLIKAVIAAGGISEDVKLKEIREVLENNFNLKWSTQRIHTTLTSLGLETNFDGKYDKLVGAGNILRQLATERNIPIEP